MTDDELLLPTLEPSWLVPPLPRHLNADEPFGGLDAVVGDFWQFALGDLRMNTARGWLAEFLVARAVGATEQRVEWDSFDVKSPDGVRIEVKSGAYLQAWKQRRLSSITFGGLASRKLDDQNRYSESPVYGADVYVFAVQTATEHAVFDPLNTDQWDFYVLPQWVLERRQTMSIALAEVQKLTSRTHFADLSAAISTAAQSCPTLTEELF